MHRAHAIFKRLLRYKTRYFIGKNIIPLSLKEYLTDKSVFIEGDKIVVIV